MEEDIRASLDQYFPRDTSHHSTVPVWCLTPNRSGCLHRFFDTSPLSPSGRYLACLHLPQEERPPEPGETAEVVVVDLADGSERTVAETRGWEEQTGANINWGKDDHTLLFSDLDTATWAPHCVRLDWPGGEVVRFGRGVSQASPDGRWILCTNPAAMRRIQGGVGVVVPDEHVPDNFGLPEDDGLFLTDTETGDCRLLISIREAVERTTPQAELAEYDEWECYFFNCKWSPQGDRVLFDLRRFPRGLDNRFNTFAQKMIRCDAFTMKLDGSELHNVVNATQWAKGGQHINWFPDGGKLSMNLDIERHGMRFCQVDRDGKNLRKMLEVPMGTGHPTVHPSGAFLVTDTYVFERCAYGDGTTPIRLVELPSGRETILARIRSETAAQKEYPSMRLDPHPAWDRSWRYLVFNAFPNGTRRVMLADLKAKIPAAR
ncbi:MAG: hypothetical protein KAI66_23570 [Lentisphaeria bacterium]|nr:hypothetical protein [Lentisphaeria bacterium]